MLVFHSTDALLHDPLRFYRRGVIMAHPESIQRYETLRDAVVAAGHELVDAVDHGMDPLLEVHSRDYLEYFRTAWDTGAAIDPSIDEIVTTQFVRGSVRRRPAGFMGQVSYHSSDTSTVIRPGSWAAAYGAAQAAISAAEAIGEHGAAYALSRPPGHHAGIEHASGFCFINNAAVAAAHLSKRYGRIAILDIDVHHGDGTQEIFYRRSDVLTVSLHAETSNYFPYFTGYEDETGEGDGSGFNLNLPIVHGADQTAYLAAIDKGLDRIKQYGPGALVVSLGLDAAAEDPVGALNVATEGFVLAARRIAQCDLPVLLVQEGGYPSEALGRNIAAFLGAFDEARATLGAANA